MRYSIVIFLLLFLTACGGYPDEIALGDGIDEPDRTLFRRAQYDLNRGRYLQARLLLNSLISTYPDSEFLPQALYAVGESFYRLGTSSDLVQAEAEFKNYITFFPTSDLTDDAQLMVAMTHIRQMERADRDPGQGLLAEIELQNFLNDYPDSEHLEEAKEKLRAVQEVLADGIFRVANFYVTVGSYPGAQDRYLEVLEKYPDFSKTPEALFRLAELMRETNNEGESIIYYGRIARDYPLSDPVSQAKDRLTEMGQPVPEANPAALARALNEPEPEFRSLASRMFGLFGGRPDIPMETAAATVIQPETDGEEADEDVEPTFEIEGTVIGENSGPPGLQ